jgi:hypothetical protein
MEAARGGTEHGAHVIALGVQCEFWVNHKIQFFVGRAIKFGSEL